jgi:hypothetical protein
MLSPHAYYAVLFLVSVYAFLGGRLDERIAAATCIIATFATNLVYDPYGSFAGVEYGVFIVDAATFFVFTLLALRSERFWPLWIAGLQLTTLMSHMFKLGRIDLMPEAYAAAARFWVYPIFLIIVIGTWRGGRRRRILQRSHAA